jgi:hypothetical protein
MIVHFYRASLCVYRAVSVINPDTTVSNIGAVRARRALLALVKQRRHGRCLRCATTMLTISVFLLTTGSVLTSVWWACKNEDVTPVVPPSDTAPA